MQKFNIRKNSSTSPSIPLQAWGGKKPLIIITGPTAAGKTALSLKLARKFNGEIVSADSRQIYRGMDIGTAKPSPLQGEGKGEVWVNGIRHHLINIRNPNQTYTLAQFKRDAIKTIRQIHKRGRVPFLVGGTALYINAIVNNLEIPEVKPNKKLRSQLERLSAAELYKKLIRLDPEAAFIIEPKNPRRIIRALEITLSGKLYSQTRKHGPPLFDILLIGVKQTAAKLKSRIEKRVGVMFKKGFVAEVAEMPKKFDRTFLAFNAIGYREVLNYLSGKITLKEAKAQIKSNTWQSARRQMTWFKKFPVVWVASEKQAEILIRKHLNRG